MNPTMFAGIPIRVRPDHPKMQLSKSVDWLPEGFKAEMNAWMREFFGTSNLIEDGRVLPINGEVWVNPRTLAELRRRFEEQRP